MFPQAGNIIFMKNNGNSFKKYRSHTSTNCSKPVQQIRDQELPIE